MFVSWVVIIFIGYWLLWQENYTLQDDIAAAYYKIFMTTMITGGISLQLLSTIRYWYWDGYYLELDAKRQAARWEALDNSGDTFIDDSSSGGSSTPQPSRPSNNNNSNSNSGRPSNNGGNVNFINDFEPEL